MMTTVPVPTGTTSLNTTLSPTAMGTSTLTKTTVVPTATTTVSTTVTATSSVSTTTVSVSYNNHDFKPSPLTISRGTTVIWTNKDPSPISFASDASAPVAFRSGSLASGSTYQFTFTQPGLYRYRTETSPQSGGQITVT
jgi:plastocyanin